MRDRWYILGKILQAGIKNTFAYSIDNYEITYKFPTIITHDKKFKNVEKGLELFYERMEPI
jgi:hypothetical protein